jgi:hypothetical protein
LGSPKGDAMAKTIQQVFHADYLWQCMNFDSESGHSCTHCGAKYPADHHEAVEHTEACPHAALDLATTVSNEQRAEAL